jgi:hypothetical protein
MGRSSSQIARGVFLLACYVAAACTAPAESDPQAVSIEARARAGHMDCYSPDIEARTCRAMSSYIFTDAGGVTNVAHALMGDEPQIIMTAQSAVEVTDTSVCGRLSREDFEAAQFTIDGEPAPADMSATLRANIIEHLGDMLGKEICTTYVVSGDAMQARVTIDGAPDSEPPEPVIWVTPDEGYRVGS